MFLCVVLGRDRLIRFHKILIDYFKKRFGRNSKSVVSLLSAFEVRLVLLSLWFSVVSEVSWLKKSFQKMKINLAGMFGSLTFALPIKRKGL